MQVTVNRILEKKGHEVWSVAPDASVFNALEIMADKNTGAVLVRDKETIVGILSERDYARKGRCSQDTRVSEVMTRKVTCIGPGSTGDECLALMTTDRIRHLPVVKEGKLIGLVSIGDVVKAVIGSRGVLIDQLERYIMGTPA